MNLHLDDKKIWSLYLEGYTQQKIANALNCSKKTIGNHINKMKDNLEKFNDPFFQQEKKTQSHPMKKNIPFDEILELYNKGLSDQEIAEKLGCTRSNITIRLNKKGIYRGQEKIDNIPLRNKISESLKGRFIGEKNPNYKGYNDEKQLARGLFKTISNEIIRNSNFHCTICGQKSQVYHVHHIKSFSVILNEFLEDRYSGNINTFVEELTNNCPEFWDKNNLIMVCKNCHYKIHYTDNPELSPYRWESATTIENIDNIPNIIEEVSRVESSDSKCEGT